MKFKIVVFSVAVIARVFSIEIIFVKTATIVAFFFLTQVVRFLNLQGVVFRFRI